MMSVSSLMSSEILFVVHDAGESLAFQPVIDIMMKDLNLNMTVLCLGEPSTSIYSNYPNSFVLSDIGIDIDIEDGTEDSRAQMLSDAQLGVLVESVQPSIGICGMVYGMQAQICSSLRRTIDLPSYSMTFFDGFGLWSNQTVMGTYFTNPNPEAVRSVMTSAEDQTSAINAEVTEYCTAVTTGNPTLQSWKATAENETRKHDTRTYLYGGAAGASTIGVIYAGGYGGDDYTASLHVFCSTAHDLSTPLESPRGTKGVFKFVFAPHPGYPSNYEAELFDSWGCLEDILVLSTESGYSTSELVVASNVSISECSTVGGQSSAVGVPHAYVNAAPGSACNDVFTLNNIIPAASSSDELQSILSTTFNDWNYYVDPTVLEAAGVPINGTGAIMEQIYGHIRGI